MKNVLVLLAIVLAGCIDKQEMARNRQASLDRDIAACKKLEMEPVISMSGAYPYVKLCVPKNSSVVITK